MSNKADFYQKERTEKALKTFYEERDKERATVKKREEYFEDIERRARKMATEIISQNSIYASEDETHAGLEKGAKSVYSLPTLDLLKKAEKSRSEYNANRTRLMQDLHKKNAKLKLDINNLKEQVNIGDNTLSHKTDEIKKLKDKLIEISKEHKTVFVSPVQQSKKSKEIIKNKTKELGEKVGERKVADILDSLDAEDTKLAVKLTDKEKIKALTAKLQNTETEVWERAKNLFAIIGSTGLSLVPDIQNEYHKRLKNQGKNTDIDKVRQNSKNAFDKLELLGVISKGSFSYWASKVTYYLLTGIGIKVYKDLTGKSPVTAEITNVTSAHSNPEHGYGIVKLAEYMREFPNRFSEISEYNKGGKGKTLKVLVRMDDGKKEQKTIEPDIAFIEDEEERFIEYELVTQSLEEYYMKINKYVSYGMKHIIFIFPKNELRDDFKRYVKAFIAKKKKLGIEYPDLNFYLYTVNEFKDMCEEGDKWKPYDSTQDSRYSKTPEELEEEKKVTQIK